MLLNCCCGTGGGGYTIPGCPCTAIPGTIYMHVAHPVTNGTNNLIFPSALTRGPKPSDLATYLTDDPGYYSPTTFTSTNGLYKFRYIFGCYLGLYYVAGLMVPGSTLGYPGQFSIMQWLVGLPGNTCAGYPGGSGFSLTNGATGVTTYKTMGITIDGTGPA